MRTDYYANPGPKADYNESTAETVLSLGFRATRPPRIFFMLTTIWKTRFCRAKMSVSRKLGLYLLHAITKDA